MEIKVLTQADAGEFWAVRLRAVREHPEAFGWSFAELRALPPQELARRFRADWVDGGFMLGAFDRGRLVGTLGLSRPLREKLRHRATVRAVYVAPEARGQRVASALLGEAIRRAREQPGLDVLELSVGVGNERARRLYAEFGFEQYGVERWALKVGDGYVDEALLALRLGGGAPPRGRGKGPQDGDAGAAGRHPDGGHAAVGTQVRR